MHRNLLRHELKKIDKPGLNPRSLFRRTNKHDMNTAVMQYEHRINTGSMPY